MAWFLSPISLTMHVIPLPSLSHAHSASPFPPSLSQSPSVIKVGNSGVRLDGLRERGERDRERERERAGTQDLARGLGLTAEREKRDWESKQRERAERERLSERERRGSGRRERKWVEWGNHLLHLIFIYPYILLGGKLLVASDFLSLQVTPAQRGTLFENR